MLLVLNKLNINCNQKHTKIGKLTNFKTLV
jgi:hypothetical protein